MRPCLLALVGLVWSAASISWAQSNAVFYGAVDIGVGSTHEQRPQGQKRKQTTLISSGYDDSLIGLRGKTSLGNGLAAQFKLESLYDAGSGQLFDSDYFFKNAAWVGLSSPDYGAVRLGRQHTVGQAFGSQLEVASWVDMDMGTTFRASDNYQVPNAISYFSPSRSGLSFGASYSPDIQVSRVGRSLSRAASLAVQYQQGPMLLVATWDKIYLSRQDYAHTHHPQAWQLGAIFDFNSAQLALAWSRQSNGDISLGGGDPADTGLGLGVKEFAEGGKLDAYLLGLSLPAGPRGTVLAQWSLVKPRWVWHTGDKAASAVVATLGYLHALSPRTKLYAMAGFANRYSISEQFLQGQGRTSRFMAGIYHAF